MDFRVGKNQKNLIKIIIAQLEPEGTYIFAIYVIAKTGGQNILLLKQRLTAKLLLMLAKFFVQLSKK